jgi:acetoacetyl-CoA synthetase
MSVATVSDEISAVFRSALTVDPPAPDVDLISTGLLDSLAIVSLVTELELRCGVRIPLDRIDLPSIRTIRGLQQLIEGAREDEAQHASSQLVLLRAGRGRPVFLAHTSHASAMTATPLARVLRTERPIYAFQAVGYRSDAAPQTELTTIAATYVSEMLAVQPNGPYSVAGLSFGGLIAYEIARQLTEAGERVDMLAMIDTQANPALLSTRARLMFRLRWPIRYAKHILEDPAARLPMYTRKLRRKISDRDNYDPYEGQLILEDVLPFLAIADAIEAAYRPSAYEGDAVLLVAAKRHPGKCDPRKIWAQHVQGALRTVPISGEHSQLYRNGMDVVGAVLSPLLGDRA